MGSGRWQAVVRRVGFPSKSKTFRTKSAALAWARDREDEFETGVFVQEPDLFCTLLDRYAKEILPRKKGQAQERSRIRLLREGFGEVLITRLTADRIVAWADDRLVHVGSDTVSRDLALLSSVIETAQVLWSVGFRDNPARIAIRILLRTRTLKSRVSRDRRLQPGEYRRLRSALGPTMRELVRFALETAMRRSEIARVSKSDLSVTGLRIVEDKAGRTSVIPISRKARRILEGCGGFGMRPDSITQAFDRACKRSGISDLRFHDLRHEATSRLFERGLSIEEVASITRHSDWRSLKRYTHPSALRIAEKLG